MKSLLVCTDPPPGCCPEFEVADDGMGPITLFEVQRVQADRTLRIRIGRF